MPNTVTKIGNRILGYSGVTTVTISRKVKVIPEETFMRCKKLKKVTMPNVTEIGFFAFEECVKIKSITLPKTLKKIGDCAFAGCSGLTKVTVPAKTKKIGLYAFQYCKGMKVIKLPKGVKLGNGKDVFFQCSKKLKIKYYKTK